MSMQGGRGFAGLNGWMGGGVIGGWAAQIPMNLYFLLENMSSQEYQEYQDTHYSCIQLQQEKLDPKNSQ